MGGIGSGKRTLTLEQRQTMCIQRQNELRPKFDRDTVAVRPMLLEQKRRCAICRDYLRKPHVDHCHETGQARGLLCNSCNLMLGFARDNTRTLASAIKYLKHHKQKYFRIQKKRLATVVAANGSTEPA